MRFLIFFIGYIYLEIIVTSYVGEYFGSFGVFLEIILSALIAVFILVNFKYNLYETFISLSRQEISKQQAISSSIGSFIGAILLFLPGVITDSFGFLLQISIFYNLILRLFRGKISDNNTTKDFKNEEIIDTKFITDEYGNDVFVADTDRKKDN
jgi:2-isopropylmalate synthase/UPF0716 protein FxsA